jgi:hypothetical protein
MLHQIPILLSFRSMHFCNKLNEYRFCYSASSTGWCLYERTCQTLARTLAFGGKSGRRDSKFGSWKWIMKFERRCIRRCTCFDALSAPLGVTIRVRIASFLLLFNWSNRFRRTGRCNRIVIELHFLQISVNKIRTWTKQWELVMQSTLLCSWVDILDLEWMMWLNVWVLRKMWRQENFDLGRDMRDEAGKARNGKNNRRLSRARADQALPVLLTHWKQKARTKTENYVTPVWWTPACDPMENPIKGDSSNSTYASWATPS